MENPPGKKRSSPRVSVDRISNLPDSVISHILSFLPTRNVVATSILSTRWKLQWTKVTTLDFILEDNDDEGVTVKKFVLFVNKVLININSQRLQRFGLQWPLGCQREPEYISVWIGFAISRCIRTLVIDLGRKSVDIHLPGTLFTCPTLEVLKIYACFVLKVPGVVCLPKLDVLDIRRLYCESDECLTKLISGSPALSTLTIVGHKARKLDFRVCSPSITHIVVCTFDGNLEIDAPNLKSLALGGVKECSVTWLDSVDHMVLYPDVCNSIDSDNDAVDGVYIGRCNSIVKLVEAMNRVKFLTFKKSILKALSYATTPLSVCFERLIKLDVSVECCHWSSLGVVLTLSTRLQVLKITKRGCGYTDHELCWNDPTEVPECLSSSLEKVSFVEFKGLEDEMELIEYILQHGEVLQSFNLKSAADHSDLNIKYQLLQHIAAFPRFSRACRLHFD